MKCIDLTFFKDFIYSLKGKQKITCFNDDACKRCLIDFAFYNHMLLFSQNPLKCIKIPSKKIVLESKFAKPNLNDNLLSTFPLYGLFKMRANF